jgi:hypothetical protein
VGGNGQPIKGGFQLRCPVYGYQPLAINIPACFEMLDARWTDSVKR